MSFFELDDLTIYLAATVRILTNAAHSLDDVAPLASGSGYNPVRGVRKWHDGTGKTITVNPDGRLYYAGSFIGYRDAHGRITNGTGNLIGYLKDTGEYHGADGAYLGRVFG
jgi:hypothetical protein